MRVTAKEHGHLDMRVTVDGVDVTERCYEADDEEGIVKCYAFNGHRKLSWNEAGDDLVCEELRGDVVIEMKDQGDGST